MNKLEDLKKDIHDLAYNYWDWDSNRRDRELESIDNQLEKLIKAGNAMADHLCWIINERDKPNTNIAGIPRIGMTLAMEDWDYRTTGRLA